MARRHAHGKHPLPHCVACGVSIVMGWNRPVRTAEDGTRPSDDPDPLCDPCFQRRHSADALADAAERQNEDRIRYGRR